MKAIRHGKVILATCMCMGGAFIGFAGSGLNKSEDITPTANVESFDVVGSEEMNTVLSLERMDNVLVGATIDEVVELPEEVTASESKETAKEKTIGQETETAAETAAKEKKTNKTKKTKAQKKTESDFFLVNVDEYLNVRQKPSSEAEVVGKIYTTGGGKVLKRGKKWSKIQSGNVTGYVNNDYVWFGDEAEQQKTVVCPLIAVSNTDNLRLRAGAGTDYSIEEVIEKGISMTVLREEGDWYAVSYSGSELYVSKDFVDAEYVVGTGITLAEEQELIRLEQERIAAEKAEEERRKAEEEARRQEIIANSGVAEIVYQSAYSVSEEEAYLLACVVSTEAGSECYEGKLAVANIVLNRLSSGKYGSTVHDVVYARGQFSVVTNGTLDRCLNNGPNAESLQAAAAALEGQNNVPAYTSFCADYVANYGSYTSYSIIGNQVFYN